MICMFPVVRARGVHGSRVGWGEVGMKRIECRVAKTKRFAILVQIRLGTLCQTRVGRSELPQEQVFRLFGYARHLLS
jgi:hypothetical protein